MSYGLINKTSVNTLLWIAILFSWCSLSYAAPHILNPVVSNKLDGIHSFPANLPMIMLTEANTEFSGQEKTGPKDGSLVVPGDDGGEAAEKKCMTICEKWGQDCVINPRTGTRKCRRTCKQFGEECF